MTMRVGLVAATGLAAAMLSGSLLVGGSASSVAIVSSPLTTVKTCVLTATPAGTTVETDAHVRQQFATTNSGTATSMNVSTTSTRNQRVYIKFDLTQCSPQVPSTASVKAAILRLYATALPATCRTHDVFRVSSSWTETGITWNDQPFGTDTNNPPTAQRTSSIGVGLVSCQNSTLNAYVSGWDVKTDVQAFVDGTANHGWMIRDDAENAMLEQSATYSTKDANVLAQAPQLVVTYTKS